MRFSRGFSLIELSIVLVILGLLAGSLLVGQSLIRASELRSVSADFQRYQTAINAFRDKYFGLPGDLSNATAIWGSAGGTGADATCFSTVATTTATCNGNANGQIDVTFSYGEAAEAWKQLTNAGLIAGNYTGVKGVGWVPGVNTPGSKITNAGFSYAYSSITGAFNEYWSGANNGNAIFFGTASDLMRYSNTIKPEEAWNIDNKLDDGNPSTGRVTSNSTSACNSGSYPTASYALSLSSRACSLRFVVD